MRFAILTAVGAALTLAAQTLAATPVAAHGYSSYEEEDSVEYSCPLPAPVHHHVVHHVRAACHAPVRHHVVRSKHVVACCHHVAADWRHAEVWSQQTFHPTGPWAQAWHDHFTGPVPPGCQPFASKGPQGGRMVEEHGMRCHQEGAIADQGHDGWMGHRSWQEDNGWHDGRVSMTDRYGYLTWPGKTHIRLAAEDAPQGPPMGPPPPQGPPMAGPQHCGCRGPHDGGRGPWVGYPPGPPPAGLQPPPPEAWEVHP